MERRKFIFKVSIFVCIVAVFFFSIEFLIRGIPNDYKYKFELIEEYSDSVETLILGNSHARDAVDPAYFDSFTINLANSAQPLKYDYQLLEMVLKKGDNLKTVVLPISYFSMYFNLDESSSHYLNKNYHIYFGFEVSKLKYHFEVFSGLSLRIQIGRIINYYLLNKEPEIVNLGYSESTQIATLESLKENSILTATRQRKYLESGKENFNDNLILINKIIELAYKNDLNIVIFTPPFHSEFVSLIGDDYIEKNYLFCDSLDRKYDKIQFVNFLGDGNFLTTDFKNESHLNSYGAKKVSITINKICNSLNRN